MLKISVVIVSWNTRELLGRCLASVEREAESFAEDEVEVLVVDNGSTDGTVPMIRSDFPSVILLENKGNVGFAAANNQALAVCSGQYVLLLNPDTELKSGSLSTMTGTLDSDSSISAAGPLLVGQDGRMQTSCYPLPTLSRELWRLLHLDCIWPLAVYRMDKWERDRPREVETLQGACLMVRRSVLDQVGVLDERFFIYTEEIDLCRRISAAGGRLFWTPAAEVVHHGGGSTRQVAGPMFIELYRSKLQYFRKHHGAAGALLYKLILFVIILPRIAAAPIASIFSSFHRPRLLAVTRLYRLLLAQLPML